MRSLSVFVALLLAFTLLPCALAQGIAAEAGPFAIPLSSRDIAKYNKLLAFDAEQAASAKTLYQGYRAAFKGAAKAADAKLEEMNEKMKENQDWEKFEQVRNRLMTDFVAEADKANASFFDDLKSLCSPQQAEKFASVEMTRRRDVGMRIAFAAGEGADLIDILSVLKIDRPTDAKAGGEFKEAIDQYEQDIDRAAKEKDVLFRGMLKIMTEKSAEDDQMKLITKFMSDYYAASVRIRDINRKTARLIEPHLPVDKKSDFEAEIRRRSFPRLYNESKVDKRLAAAAKLADLNADQKDRLKALSESYRREADAANAAWAVEVEAKQAKLSADFMAAMMGGEDGEDGFAKAKKARKELDASYLKRVEEVLNADQLTRMPTPEPEEPHHEPEFMPEFDQEKSWKAWEEEKD